jgi:integrase/recombinase XerD
MRESFSVRFYLNPTKARSGKYQIYARIIVDREKAEVATGLFVKESDWFSTEGKARATAVNDEISEIEACLRRLRRKILDGNGTLTAKAIKAHYKGNKRIKVGIMEYFRRQVEELELFSESEKVSTGTVKNYRTTFMHIGNFLKVHKRVTEFQVNEIDYSFINEFDVYLKAKYKSKLERSISNNYANKQHSRLRTVLHKAVREGLINSNPYQTFRLKAEKTFRDYLTEDELQALTNHVLQNNLSLQRVRDYFLFSCYTGLRYEDAFNLKMGDIVRESDGTMSINITMGKTNDQVYVPMLEPAIRIMCCPCSLTRR